MTIPATLISNDPQEVREFVAAYQKVIFKPMYGGVYTKLVT
ncbi:MAG: hypothetical protein ABI180_10790 [Microcoleus sp.]